MKSSWTMMKEKGSVDQTGSTAAMKPRAWSRN